MDGNKNSKAASVEKSQKNEYDNDLIENLEFSTLNRQLTKEGFEGLENYIKEGGQIDSISVWNQRIVDGYNIYKIYSEFSIPIKKVEVKFSPREKAKRWIVQHQLARTNLTDYERIELTKLRNKLRGIVEDGVWKKLTNLRQNRGKGVVLAKKTDNLTDTFKMNKWDLETERDSDTQVKTSINSKKEISVETGLSGGTIARDDVIMKREKDGFVTKETIERLRNGDTIINGVYNEIKRQSDEDYSNNLPKREHDLLSYGPVTSVDLQLVTSITATFKTVTAWKTGSRAHLENKKVESIMNRLNNLLHKENKDASEKRRRGNHA